MTNTDQEKFQPLKQKPGSKNCYAVAAAMALNLSIAEVEQELWPAVGAYSDIDIYRLMLNFGYVCGFIQEFPEGHNSLNEYGLFRLTYRLTEIKAFIIVKSETYEGKTHAIYWDGNNIYDPNPNSLNGRPLNSYCILNIIPIHKL